MTNRLLRTMYLIEFDAYSGKRLLGNYRYDNREKAERTIRVDTYLVRRNPKVVAFLEMPEDSNA